MEAPPEAVVALRVSAKKRLALYPPSGCRRMVADPAGYYEEDRKGGTMAEPINVKCPSCDQILAAADEGGLVSALQEHLYEEHALEMPPERYMPLDETRPYHSLEHS
jgi:hypothetical protein